jgi:hypothetical protein
MALHWLTTFSATHRQMLDWFVTHLPMRPGDTLSAAQLPQLCESGTYFEPGWKTQITGKIDALIELTGSVPPSGTIACLDVDITVFRHFEDEVVEHLQINRTEYAFQNDGAGGMCAGFMLFERREVALGVLGSVKSRLPEAESEQPALNQVIARSDAILLSPSIVWTYGLHGLGLWRPGIVPHSPRGIAAHHANWTIGLENKMMLLRAVVAEQMNQAAAQG